MTQLLSRRELAAILKVSPRWIYDRARLSRDPLPEIKTGHFIRYDATEVAAWLQRQSNTNGR